MFIDSCGPIDSNKGMSYTLQVSELRQELSTIDVKSKLILKGISFAIPSNSLTGFIGVNGAGKTTTIKSVLDFIHPSSGSVEFFGSRGLSESTRKRIGFMPERPYFYDFLTGQEFLALHWQLRGRKIDSTFSKRCDEVLEQVDLARGKNLRLRQFSKGMLQRLGIAQAIIHTPEFLILDEPMSGLDPDGRILVKGIIRDLHRRGTTIFFSSHLLQDMEELCDRLVIIDGGEIIYEGESEAVVRPHAREFTISWRPQGENALATELCLIAKLQEKIDQLRSEKAEIFQITEKKIGLEEAFVRLRQKRSLGS